MRFIYQGQFLNDQKTISSYNIKDQSTIHCHITSKPQSQAPNESSSSSNQTTVSNTSNVIRQRQIASINQALSQTDQTETNLNNQRENQTPQSIVETTTNVIRSSSAAQTNHAHLNLMSIDLNNLLLPLVAIILAISWYFRVHFRHFFSPLSTLILFIFTLIYSLFLFNCIYTALSARILNWNFLLQHGANFFNSNVRPQYQPPPQQPAQLEQNRQEVQSQ